MKPSVFRDRIDLDPSCVLYLPFYKYGGEQQKIWDMSGYNNHGAIYGAIPGICGWSFDGVNDYVCCGTGSVLNNIIKGITLMAWFYKFSYAYGAIISKYSHYEIHLDPSNCFMFQTNNSTGDVRAGTNFQLDLNKWYFGVFTYDYYNTPHHRLFVNGENCQLVWMNSNDDGNQADGGLYPTPTNPCDIGVRLTTTLPYYGFIGEAYIYNRALSPVEIRNIYELTRAKYGV